MAEKMFNRNNNKGFVITDIVIAVVVCSILLGTVARLFIVANSARNNSTAVENMDTMAESDNVKNNSYSASNSPVGKYDKITEVIPMKRNLGKIETEGGNSAYTGDFVILEILPDYSCDYIQYIIGSKDGKVLDYDNTHYLNNAFNRITPDDIVKCIKDGQEGKTDFKLLYNLYPNGDIPVWIPIIDEAGKIKDIVNNELFKLYVLQDYIASYSSTKKVCIEHGIYECERDESSRRAKEIKESELSSKKCSTNYTALSEWYDAGNKVELYVATPADLNNNPSCIQKANMIVFGGFGGTYGPGNAYFGNDGSFVNWAKDTVYKNLKPGYTPVADSTDLNESVIYEIYKRVIDQDTAIICQHGMKNNGYTNMNKLFNMLYNFKDNDAEEFVLTPPKNKDGDLLYDPSYEDKIGLRATQYGSGRGIFNNKELYNKLGLRENDADENDYGLLYSVLDGHLSDPYSMMPLLFRTTVPNALLSQYNEFKEMFADEIIDGISFDDFRSKMQTMMNNEYGLKVYASLIIKENDINANSFPSGYEWIAYTDFTDIFVRYLSGLLKEDKIKENNATKPEITEKMNNFKRKVFTYMLDIENYTRNYDRGFGGNSTIYINQMVYETTSNILTLDKSGSDGLLMLQALTRGLKKQEIQTATTVGIIDIVGASIAGDLNARTKVAGDDGKYYYENTVYSVDVVKADDGSEERKIIYLTDTELEQAKINGLNIYCVIKSEDSASVDDTNTNLYYKEFSSYQPFASMGSVTEKKVAYLNDGKCTKVTSDSDKYEPAGTESYLSNVQEYAFKIDASELQGITPGKFGYMIKAYTEVSLGSQTAKGYDTATIIVRDLFNLD